MMAKDFQTFLSFWCAENIYPLRTSAQPAYLDYLVRRSADELIDAATIKGFYGQLTEAAKPYGGVGGFVREKCEAVSL
jgi:hypothetical protein